MCASKNTKNFLSTKGEKKEVFSFVISALSQNFLFFFFFCTLYFYSIFISLAIPSFVFIFFFISYFFQSTNLFFCNRKIYRLGYDLFTIYLDMMNQIHTFSSFLFNSFFFSFQFLSFSRQQKYKRICDYVCACFKYECAEGNCVAKRKPK